MRCLLDTHAFLWWVSDDSSLGSAARGLIGDPEVEVFVSAASIWEIAIKTTLGKLEFDADPLVEVRANGMRELAMTGRHALTAGSLPRYHDDPFDRMLVAQAKLESMILVSRDAQLRQYGVDLVF
jgi:PIN domain nuclease of toxin-antitoxin system